MVTFITLTIIFLLAGGFYWSWQRRKLRLRRLATSSFTEEQRT